MVPHTPTPERSVSPEGGKHSFTAKECPGRRLRMPAFNEQNLIHFADVVIEGRIGEGLEEVAKKSVRGTQVLKEEI